tara:strand:+ start:787 stop:1305 length:519 start_codon:yes stop_codon:yes gene_type:complete
MEFRNYEDCLEYYEKKYQYLPSEWVKCCLDFDLKNPNIVIEDKLNKPLTNKQRRELKRENKLLVKEDIKKRSNEIIYNGVKNNEPIVIENGFSNIGKEKNNDYNEKNNCEIKNYNLLGYIIKENGELFIEYNGIKKCEYVYKCDFDKFGRNIGNKKIKYTKEIDNEIKRKLF